MALDNILDKAGNKYGGTTSGLAGFGDTVQDVSGTVGTVQKIWIDPNDPLNLSKALVLLTGANQNADRNIHEIEAFTRALQITAHADGTGLVSGGVAVSFPTTVPPTSYNFLQNPLKIV
jgi:hypothetical protein